MSALKPNQYNSDHIEDSLPLAEDGPQGAGLPEGPALDAGERVDETNTYGGPTRLGQNDRNGLEPGDLDDLESDLNAESSLGDGTFGEEGNPRVSEIAVGDIESWTDESGIRSPDLYDQNVPGEVDIEALDENALTDTDIPRDALLDPLED